MAAVLAAGGRGDRARTSVAGVAKQWRLLGNRSIVEWSLDVLVAAGCDPVVLVVPDPGADQAMALAKRAIVTAGGATRQQSVARGLALIATELVVVHDGARPFATPELVRECLAALAGVAGAVAAVPLDETVKRVEDDRVRATVDRSGLWRVQTPQAFVTGELERAHALAVAAGYSGSDDAELVERAGGSVRVVRGPRDNIKLTWPEDFALAESLVARR
ncbi:2-C-methyl-D-erythritol 4-phosphate cytidylyltransferase [soil metagenome]